MERPRQRTMWTARQYRPSLAGFALPIGISFLLLFPGCAQLDQLMGKQADSGEPAPQTQTAAPAAQTHENSPIQATVPISKSAAKKKKSEEAHSAGVATEPHQLVPSHAPAHPTVPAEGRTKQAEPELTKSEQDKALAEKEQPGKEKKSRVASDKKKKPAKSQAESQPPTDDVFLSPIPLPSKPAAIGGSGG